MLMCACGELLPDDNTEHADSPASQASGGAPATSNEATGGTNAAGETSAGGTGSGTSADESLCEDDSGTPIPYDYSFGVVSEYAGEVSMSCDIGGYLMPLAQADPEGLTQVNAFVIDATAWYRSKVLGCTDTPSELEEDAFGLLPVSQSADLTAADFDASEALFFMVIDRHDSLPDAVSKANKVKLKDRIKSLKAHVVKSTADGLTKTLSEPDCMPSTSS
jgi:hypothetical protein